MSKRIISCLALICAVFLIIPLVCGTLTAFASGNDEDDAGPESRDTEIAIFVDGILVGTGIKVESTTYVPLQMFCEVLDKRTEYVWDAESKTAVAEMEELTIVARLNTKYMTANDRTFFLPGGVKGADENVMVPVRELAKAFGVSVEWDAEYWTVSIKSENINPIQCGESYYDEEDLVWLARVINAESGNQPFEGKIGVGNVVLNRVLSPACPDTVEDVIFDSQHGVQFHTAQSQAIFAEPNEESVEAAKACLDNYNTVGDSIYFVNPRIGLTSWFVQTRTFVRSIGEHDFYV